MMDCQCGNKGKYKCPKCFEKYCSSECCSSHKALCKIARETSEPAVVVRHPPRNFLMEEEDETVLTDEDLGKMHLNATLKNMLEHKAIRKVFEEIDRSENRLGALRSVSVQDKQGRSPISLCFDEMLKSIGYLDADGVSLL